LGKAASLLRDRNFVKGPGGKSSARDEHTAFWFFIREALNARADFLQAGMEKVKATGVRRLFTFWPTAISEKRFGT
jgi:hypothetical protein